MSDTPSPSPSSESLKPKLSLAPKTPSSTPAPAPGAEAPAAPAPTLQTSSSTGTPPAIAAAAATGAKPGLKLQGAVHPSTPKAPEPQFTSPMPRHGEESVSGALVALSAIAAAAAITFAVLLFLKHQA